MSPWAARGDPGGEASTAESRDAQAEHTPNALLKSLNTPLGARSHVVRARGSHAARAEGSVTVRYIHQVSRRDEQQVTIHTALESDPEPCNRWFNRYRPVVGGSGGPTR